MSKQEKKLVPKLRFPEFLDEEGWEQKKLKDLFEIGSGKDYKHLSTGVIPVYGSGGYMLSVDDFLYDGESVCIGRKGTIDKPMLLNGKFWTVDTLFYTHSFKDCSPRFIFSIFQNINWLKHNEAGGVPSLSKTTINEIPTYIPKPKEQQKVADCLSSLDDLITAQNQKVEALKQHKKGLMQQLFPAQGEPVPKLRFSEFENEEPWQLKKFGEICKFVRGPFGGALKKEIFVKDGYAVYEQSHAIYANFESFRYYITEKKFNELKRFSVQPRDIIMSCSGTMGKFAVIPQDAKKGVINQALLKLSVNKEFNLDFVMFILELPENQEKLLSQSAGGAIKNVVGVGEIKEIELNIPNAKEQQKIANCLCSLNSLIATETQQLEAFRTHKKGLMQQLFPTLEEVA
jgi:type I restriction enzyme S subunit